MRFDSDTYRYSQTITHQGVVFAFSARATAAAPTAFSIGYTVLALAPENPSDDDSWRDFQVLEFPTQIRPVGMELITVDFEDTAIPVADAPFQVLSDGQYVYVFRQSTKGTLYMDRFVFDQVTTRLANAWEVRYRRSRNPDVPANRRDTFGHTDMDGEQFVEPTTDLTFVQNVAGGRFAVLILPTELQDTERWQIFSANAATGTLDSYSVLRAADGTFDLTGAIDPATKTVKPDARFALTDAGGASLTLAAGPGAALYMRQERLKDEYGRFQVLKKEARVMVAVPTGTDGRLAVLDFALGRDGRLAQVAQTLACGVPPVGTSLAFDAATGVYATLPRLASSPSSAATVEAWVSATTFGTGSDAILASAPSEALPLALTLEGGRPQLTVWTGGGTRTARGPVVELQTWTHLAGTWDGSTATIYVNGQPYTGAGTAPAATTLASGYQLGGAGAFTGQLAALRIWTTALDRAGILSRMGTVVGSGDPLWAQLAGYWTMDEPGDASRLTTIPNASSAGAAANGALAGAAWSPLAPPVGSSMAPVAWDANGLNAATALLDYARTLDAPSILPGSDGLVHLYYREQGSNAFSAARMDALTGRAHYAVPWSAPDTDTPANGQTGMLRFVARVTGTAMNWKGTGGLPAEVADGGDAAHCIVTLRSYTGMTETWPAVPRSLESFLAVLNGDAIQTTTDPVAAARGLVMYDYTQVTVTAGGGQGEPRPGPGTGSGIFAAYPDTRPDNGKTALVQNTAGTATLPAFVRAGLDCRWIPSPPRAALTLDQPGEVIEILPDTTSYRGELNLAGNLTMEAWLYPTANTTDPRATVLVYNKPAPAVQYALGVDPQGRPWAANASVSRVATAATLPAGQWSHVAAAYRTDYGIQLSRQRYLDAGNRTELVTPDALTAEAWVRLDRTGGTQTIVSKTGPGDLASWKLSVNGDGKPVFDVVANVDLSTRTSTVTAPAALGTGTWHHVAGVYDVAFTREVAAEFTWTSGTTNTFITIPALTRPLTASMSVEAWVKRIEPPEIPSDGDQPARRRVLDSQVIMASTNADDPCLFSLSLAKNIPSFQVDTAAHSASIAGTAELPAGQWVHVAAVYDDASGTVALYLDGLSVGTPAVSAGSGTPGTPVTQGAVYSVGGIANSNTLNGVVNQLRLWNRMLSVDEVRQNNKRPLTGGERGLVGYWPLNDRFGTTAMDLAGTSNGTLKNGANFLSVDKGAFIHKLLVDGVRVASQPVTAPPHVAEDARLRMGSGDFADYLGGTLDDVRLWKVGRMDWEIQAYQTAPLPGDAEGLVGSWPFEEGEGASTADAKGESDALILDGSVRLTRDDVNAMWVPTYFKAGWTLYVNGVQVTSADYALPSGFGNPQLTVGGMFQGQALGTFFPGAVSELRLWSVLRTAEEVRDNLYRPLLGTEAGLAGYWPASEGSGSIIGDWTGRGANGTWSGGSTPGWTTATVPLGPEGPQVRVLPGSVATPQVQTVDYPPGAAEYSDLQTTAAGDLVGVLKRCYGWTRSSALNLATGYRVGDLDVQFVGQVQTRPTLIGYLEGAPPLPSENLTVESPTTPYNYLAASTVEMVDSGETALVYSASRDNGFDLSVDAKLGFAAEQKIEAGLIVSSLLFGFISKLGVHATFEHSLGWLSEASVTLASQRSTSKKVELFGAWENNGYQVDGGRGRMYIPNNMGYALVVSGTADLFAMRVKGLGTLVSYAVAPNPDIPQDTNIIMFKLNPQYVKNGTLDGFVGYQPDHAYPNLQPGETASYFKPLEAYALKSQIEREHQQLLAYYDAFDAGSTGRRTNATHFQKGDAGDTDNDLGNILIGVKDSDAISDEEWRRRMARRNLVNTYVWNSDGGLYAEEEQFSAVREDSMGGSYDFVGKAGVYTEISMSIGLDFALDALFGGHIRTKAMKSRRETTSFGVRSTAPGEGFLNARASDQANIPAGSYPVRYEADSAAGKVNQYRFMTFYLAPRKRNFDDFQSVVDPDWLNRQGAYAGTYDPDAFALKQALVNPNEVWRVLHRVTYVNRVRESGSGTPEGETLAPDVRRPDADSLASNALLISDLPVAVGDPRPMATVSSEADALLAALEADPVYGTRLAAEHDRVKQNIMAYMRGVYEIPA